MKPLSDDASQVCVLFDPEDGRVVHIHGVTMIHSNGPISQPEVEARARKHAELLGKPVAGLKVLHVPLAAIRQKAGLRISESGDTLVSSSRPSIRKR